MFHFKTDWEYLQIAWNVRACWWLAIIWAPGNKFQYRKSSKGKKYRLGRLRQKAKYYSESTPGSFFLWLQLLFGENWKFQTISFLPFHWTKNASHRSLVQGANIKENSNPKSRGEEVRSTLRQHSLLKLTNYGSMGLLHFENMFAFTYH